MGSDTVQFPWDFLSVIARCARGSQLLIQVNRTYNGGRVRFKLASLLHIYTQKKYFLVCFI